jgi:similar to stage IV sporulation protein
VFRFLTRIVHPEAAVRVESAEPARFVDGCVKLGIPLRDLRCEDETTLTLRMRARDYKKVKPVALRTGTRLHVFERKGLPFKAAKLKGRFFLAAGGIFLFASFFVMTSFLWRIEVKEAGKIDVDMIERNLAELGIYQGRFIYGINMAKIVNEMHLRFPELGWIAVNIRGSKAEVLMRVRTLAPAIVPQNEPCDIVAAKSGVLTKVQVYKGEQAAFAGHTVAKGQVLVRGYSVTANGVERYLHSQADIYARTWYTLTAVTPVKSNETTQTGKSMNRFAFSFFGKRLNFYRNSGNPFEFCDKITLRKDLSVFGLILPITFIQEEYREVTISEKKSVDFLSKDKIKEELKSYVLPRVYGTMKSEQFYATDTADLRYFRLDLEFLELISKEQKIKIGSVNYP